MTQESHADYMERKVSEAREAAEAKRNAAEARRTAAKAERAAAKAEQNELSAQEEMRAQQWKKMLASLPPDKRAKELLKKQSEIDGVQVLWGNLLNWTNGKCQAALTSRYQQAIRLRPTKLTVDETNEAMEVVNELIPSFSSKTKQFDKLMVVRLELRQRLMRILEERSADSNAKKALQSAAGKGVKMDEDLAGSLKIAIESARNSTGGYVYLKQWSLADGTRWLKIGITNNPARRDAEQNVLPVPAVTLRLIETQSMDQASAIERALHQQLAAQKVTGAGNKELFHLDDGQLAALMAAMES
jgi:hypothetical protein